MSVSQLINVRVRHWIWIQIWIFPDSGPESRFFGRAGFFLDLDFFRMFPDLVKVSGFGKILSKFFLLDPDFRTWIHVRNQCFFGEQDFFRIYPDLSRITVLENADPGIFVLPHSIKYINKGVFLSKNTIRLISKFKNHRFDFCSV
jgi:hypothetical protein